MKCLFRENILVRKENLRRYKFIANAKRNEPNESVRTNYEKLQIENQEILYISFIRDEDCTYATSAGDDFDFENDEGDLLRREWYLKFGFSLVAILSKVK